MYCLRHKCQPLDEHDGALYCQCGRFEKLTFISRSSQRAGPHPTTQHHLSLFLSARSSTSTHPEWIWRCTISMGRAITCAATPCTI